MTLKAAIDFQPGDIVNWQHEGKFYRVEEANLHQSGWMFIRMEGHPLKVCTIWPDVQMPVRL